MADEQPGDAGDDEFAGLAPRRRARSPLMALVVIGLGALLLWHLRADLAYAFAGRTPRDLGDARSLSARGVTLGDNQYVTIAGQPERRHALYLEPRGNGRRETFFRLLGSGSRLFVRAADSAAKSEPAERWSGRLRRFDAVPYAASLREYYAGLTEVTRSLDLGALGARLGPPANADVALRDRAGEPVSVGADEPLRIDVVFPDQLEVFLARDKYPTLADARHELDRLKLVSTAGETTADEFAFVVAMPAAARDAVLSALSSRAIAFVPHQQRFTARLGELRRDGAHGERLVLPAGNAARAQPAVYEGPQLTRQAGPPSLPWAAVQSVGLAAPITVPADAWVLVEDEVPAGLLWAPLLGALLVAFCVFNLWYLVRSARA